MDSMYSVEDALSENQKKQYNPPPPKKKKKRKKKEKKKDFYDSILVLRFEKYIYSRVKSIVTDVTISYSTVQLIVS